MTQILRAMITELICVEFAIACKSAAIKSDTPQALQKQIVYLVLLCGPTVPGRQSRMYYVVLPKLASQIASS